VPVHRRGRKLLVAFCVGLIATVAATLTLSYQAVFEPSFLKARGFRKVMSDDLGFAQLSRYCVEGEFEPVRVAANEEMRKRGYHEESNARGVVYSRGHRIKAVLLPNYTYLDDGSLEPRRGSVAVWTGNSNNVFQLFAERMDWAIW